MVQLRADPWRPDLGAGAEASHDDDLPTPFVDPSVETADWSRPISPEPCDPDTFYFVDGVMRTELRVLATNGARKAWGALGSYLAGGVCCDGSARFVCEDEPVGRALILGGRVETPPLEVDAPGGQLVYHPHAVADDSPTSLRIALQRLMLDFEQRVAARLGKDGIVFADGPLHPSPEQKGATVVGVVKRMVKAYLVDEQRDLLPHLIPGQRTPLFALGNNVVDRYAWYIRLVPRRPAWHELAGLVRCEVAMELGMGRAAELADLVACHLPVFAGRPGVDPRAPQNLTPVGALEQRLKHRLGNSTFLNRALTAHLAQTSTSDRLDERESTRTRGLADD